MVTLAAVSAAIGLSLVALAWGRIPPAAPSTVECVSLWNAPRNAGLRRAVAEAGYERALVEVAYSEDRYEGCFAWFLGEDERWAMLNATRIPGDRQPLRWRIDLQGERRSEIPGQVSPPTPNAIVRPDGSVAAGAGGAS